MHGENPCRSYVWDSISLNRQVERTTVRTTGNFFCNISSIAGVNLIVVQATDIGGNQALSIPIGRSVAALERVGQAMGLLVEKWATTDERLQ